jgi:glycosyltransferase involved in cell wall biosynthesis
VASPPHIGLLYLKAFSITGGIEKVNRAILRAMADWQQDGQATATALSPYDTETDPRYFPASQLKAYAGRRWQFMIDLLWRPVRPDILLVSHINLAPAALLLKMRYPNLRIFLWAHGIEVWRPLPWWKRPLLQQAERILAVSHFTREQVIQRHGVEPDRIIVLPNCLDPFFTPPADVSKPAYLLQRYQLQPDQPVLLTVSRMHHQEAYKGYDKVLECLPALLSRHPRLVYLLAGDCAPVEKARLDQLIQSMHLKTHIRFSGYIKEEELNDHYRLADLFVMPSTGEGFGIAFIEAMACGTPALGGNRDGSPEALRPGELGYVVDPEDRHALERVIVEALSSPVKTEDFPKKAVDLFGYKQYTSQLWSIISKSNPN